MCDKRRWVVTGEMFLHRTIGGWLDCVVGAFILLIMFYSPKTRSAFTLVELLVVLAIIALLIAVLFPMAHALRRRSDQVVCLKNMGQLGNALIQYGADNDGRMPDKLAGTMYSWAGKGGKYRAFLYPARRPLNAYLGISHQNPDVEVPVARCPRDNGGTLASTQSHYDGVGSSYASNSLLDHFNGLSPGSGVTSTISRPSSVLAGSRDYVGHSFSAIRDPGRMVAMSEEGAYAAVWWSRSRWDNHPPEAYFWHHDPYLWNILYADGHASSTVVTFGVAFNDRYTFDRLK